MKLQIFPWLTHSDEFECFHIKGDTYDVPYIRSTWIVVTGGEIRNVFPTGMFLCLYSPNPHRGLISKETQTIVVVVHLKRHEVVVFRFCMIIPFDFVDKIKGSHFVE